MNWKTLHFLLVCDKGRSSEIKQWKIFNKKLLWLKIWKIIDSTWSIPGAGSHLYILGLQVLPPALEVLLTRSHFKNLRSWVPCPWFHINNFLCLMTQTWCRRPESWVPFLWYAHSMHYWEWLFLQKW